MKLLRYGPSGAEKPALLAKDGTIRCLSSVVRDIDGFALSDRRAEDDRRHRSDDVAEGRCDPCGLVRAWRGR